MAIMGIDSLKANLTNPARDYLWEVLIPQVVSGGDTLTWLVRAQSSSIPGRSIENIHIPFKQTGGMNVPGKITYSGTWKCTFIEGEDRKIFEAVYGWMQLIVQDRLGVGAGDTIVKSDITLSLLTVMGLEWNKIRLAGAWIKDLGEVALVNGGDGNIKFDVTWGYDFWEKAI